VTKAMQDNLGFYLKEVEMAKQWELKQQHAENPRSDAAEAPQADAAAPAVLPGHNLFLPHQMKQSPPQELTADEHARLRDRAEALYGAAADMDQEDGDSSLSKRA